VYAANVLEHTVSGGKPLAEAALDTGYLARIGVGGQAPDWWNSAGNLFDPQRAR
jgi:hypothetical protein